MSYESINILSVKANLQKVKEFIELLGYKKTPNPVDSHDVKGTYYWYEYNEYKSWSGIELSIIQNDNQIKVYTRSRSCRSYWDNIHQNKTIKMLRDYFGGHFNTDAGSNRYYHPPKPIPSATSSGCFLARWRFKYALVKVYVYMQNRDWKESQYKDASSGFDFLDEINPRLLSNNLIIPYIIAVWEDYFKNTFEVLFNATNDRKGILKEVRLSANLLERLADKDIDISQAVSASFSFQRPSIISKNFKCIKKDIDIAGAMKKPYRRRKITLFDSIEDLIENRNYFVHAGIMDMKLFDKKIKIILDDITEAVDRVYNEIGEKFCFVPIRCY